MAGRPRQFDEEQALAAATDVFWSKGYEAVGVRELLDVMGVCRQSFYDTFGDKRTLFLRSIERYAQQTEASFRERLEKHDRAIEGIRELVRQTAKQASGGDCRGCLAINTVVEWGDADDEVGEVVRGLMRRLKKVLTAAIDRATAEGDLPPDTDAGASADVLLFTVLGFAALGRIRMPKAMADSVVEATLAAI